MVSVSMSILIDGGQATRSRTVLGLLRLAFCGDHKAASDSVAKAIGALLSFLSVHGSVLSVVKARYATRHVAQGVCMRLAWAVGRKRYLHYCDGAGLAFNCAYNCAYPTAKANKRSAIATPMLIVTRRSSGSVVCHGCSGAGGW
jgi:hypothetical protein